MDTLDISDEEKLYNDWVANNLHYINENKSCIAVMRKLFLTGFSVGYMYKQKINAEEQLQK